MAIPYAVQFVEARVLHVHWCVQEEFARTCALDTIEPRVAELSRADHGRRPEIVI